MTDYIKLIGEELERRTKELTAAPTEVGMFTVKTANDTLRDAALRPNPQPLWLTLWYEGECCCLFSDSNLGKSVYAVQIGAAIATTQKVLYFDFELSDKQFQIRYTDEVTKELYQFPDDFYRVEINPDALSTDNFEEAVISNIEDTAIRCGAKVLIIDNITYLCNRSEAGDMAGIFMMRLMKLKKKYGLSILVIAHTPKRPLTSPITQNDLAGSKKLYNFFDSAFAIGQSAKDSNLRYIKQIKCRAGAFEYDGENVIVCTMEKQGSNLRFNGLSFATEREHLREPSDEDLAGLIESVKSMISEGKTYRSIAAELGISLGKVQRLMKK